jgi:hypothetical protein
MLPAEMVLVIRPQLPPRKIRTKIAALASVDERTVIACLLGTNRTLPPVAEAIRSAMRSMGLEVRP